MCDCHQETREEKLSFVSKQTMQAQKYSWVRCFCEIKLPLWMSYRCLYCGEYYCQKCAEKHFGMTQAEYLAKRSNNRR